MAANPTRQAMSMIASRLQQRRRMMSVAAETGKGGDANQSPGVAVCGDGVERGGEFGLGVQVGQGVPDANDEIERGSEADRAEVSDLQSQTGTSISCPGDEVRLHVDAGACAPVVA